MILPPFVGAIGIRQIFGQYGALNALLDRACACGRRAGPSTGSRRTDSGAWRSSTRFSLYPLIYLNAVAAPRQHRSRDGGGGRESRLHGLAPVPHDHPAPDPVRAVRRRDDRLHLGVHRSRHAPDLRLRPGHQRADLLRPARTSAAIPSRTRWSRSCWPPRSCSTRSGKGSSAAATRAAGSKATGGDGARPLRPLRRAGSARPCSPRSPFCAVLPHLGRRPRRLRPGLVRHRAAAHWTLDNFRIALGHELTVPAIANSLKFASAVDGDRPRARASRSPT